MTPRDKCPKCFFTETRVRVAIHLTVVHHMDVQDVMDWLRGKEEVDTSRA